MSNIGSLELSFIQQYDSPPQDKTLALAIVETWECIFTFIQYINNVKKKETWMRTLTFLCLCILIRPSMHFVFIFDLSIWILEEILYYNFIDPYLLLA